MTDDITDDESAEPDEGVDVSTDGEEIPVQTDTDEAEEAGGRERFEAEAEIELDVIEPNEEFREFSFDLVWAEELDAPWSETRHAREAVEIPKPGRG